MGGGLLIYISDHISTVRREDLETNDIEIIWREIFRSNKESILLGHVYRPASSHSLWIDDFDDMLKNVDSEDKDTFIIGDFNFDILNQAKCPCKWSNIMNVNGFTQYVDTLILLLPCWITYRGTR